MYLLKQIIFQQWFCINKITPILNFVFSTGIVKFEIAHDVYGTLLRSSFPLTLVPSVYSETSTQNVTWEDGDQLVVNIRAFDLLDNYRDETVIAYKDSTSPIISNLWLTKGNRINIAVHDLEEFNEMM